MPTQDSAGPVRFGPFEVFPERNEVRKHGRKIRLTGKAYLLLMRLLECPGEVVSREELRYALWPDGTFVDFEHSLNALINRLRSQLHDSAEQQHYIETVPALGYRFAGSVQRAPMLEAEDRLDIEKAKVLAYSATGRHSRNRAVLLWLAAALCACIIAAAITSALRQPTTPRSLALLPLQNLSGSSEHDFLADGFTDAITTELGRSPDLQVISETSAAIYKHTSKPLRAIAQELHAQYLIEGSVAQIGRRVRVNVRLVYARPDRYLWSKSYDIDLSEATRAEADIARAITSEIHAKLAPHPKTVEAGAAAVSASAYEAYLKGKYMLTRGTEESIRKAIDYFRTSIGEAQGYADAYTGLAESYTALSTMYAPPNDVMPQAREAAEIALRLDGNLSAAHAIRGRIAVLYDWDWSLAEKHLKRAIELNGSLAAAHVAYVDLMVARGRYEEAAAEIKKAEMLDPVSLANSLELQLDAFDAEKFDLMTVCARKALEIDPNFSWSHTLLGWVAARRRNISAGLAQAEQGAQNATSSEQLALLGQVQVMAGQVRRAHENLERLLSQRRKGYVCGHAIAIIYASMGRKTDALQWLDTAYRERSECMPFVERDPTMVALRMEPRFQHLTRQIYGN